MSRQISIGLLQWTVPFWWVALGPMSIQFHQTTSTPPTLLITPTSISFKGAGGTAGSSIPLSPGTYTLTATLQDGGCPPCLINLQLPGGIYPLDFSKPTHTRIAYTATVHLQVTPNDVTVLATPLPQPLIPHQGLKSWQIWAIVAAVVIALIGVGLFLGRHK